MVWTLRDAEGGLDLCDAPRRGMVLDYPNIRTGWEYGTGRPGEAPERVWNADPAVYEPPPDSEGWKRCFSVPVALDRTTSATWSQANLAARSALDDLRRVIETEPDHGDALPVIKMTGTRKLSTAGGATVIPVFTIVKWVDPPPCLAAVADHGDGDDVDDSPAPARTATSRATRPQSAPAPEPEPAPEDDPYETEADWQDEATQPAPRRNRGAAPAEPPVSEKLRQHFEGRKATQAARKAPAAQPTQTPVRRKTAPKPPATDDPF